MSMAVSIKKTEYKLGIESPLDLAANNNNDC